MFLSKWEERALQGEYGEALQIAMRFLVNMGEIFGAEKLIEISHAHISGISYFNIGDEGIEFLRDLAKVNATTRTYTTANPYSISLDLPHKFPRNIVAKQAEIVELLNKIGIDEKSYTCLPYILRRPAPGEHLAWAESSAVIYANSILGARTNREGGISALMAAIAGRTYYSGMHLDEFRKPTEVFIYDGKVDSIAIASLLGIYIGLHTQGIPYIAARSIAKRDIVLRNLLASIATTSSSPMAFIEGVTKENVDEQYLSSLGRHVITESDLRKYGSECNAPVLLLGCPHVATESELNELLTETYNSIKSGKLKANRIIVTIAPTVEFRSSETRNLVDKLRSADVEVLILRGCTVVTNIKMLNIDSVATPHGKAAYYLEKLWGVKSCISGTA